MITLTNLRKIADDKRTEEEVRLKELKESELNAYEKQYRKIVRNINKRLLKAANEKQNHLEIASFSAFGGIVPNVNKALYDMRGNHGNYYCAWGKTIFEQDVIKHMSGNLRRVYEFCLKNKLNPSVDYWADGGGMDEGFEIVVKW